jgi:hypothetical protein
MLRNKRVTVRFENNYVEDNFAYKKTLSEEFKEAEEEGRRLAKSDIAYATLIDSWAERERKYAVNVLDEDESAIYYKNIWIGEHQTLPSVCSIQ